jgi:UDP-N-acetylglucosamine 1-carboxyvinyltransferase
MLVINGGKGLEGEINISGSKNSSIPILVATVLTNKPVTFFNLPNVSDVHDILNALRHLGKSVKFGWDAGSWLVEISGGIEISDISGLDRVSQTRASVLFMGPLLGVLKRCKIRIPGGCKIGARQIDLHVKILREMGAQIDENSGLISSTTLNLKPVEFEFPKISVGATENAIMAGVLTLGKTVLKNVAIEPEIQDLIEFLKDIGADMLLDTKARTIIINGVEALNSASYTIKPDRIEAFSYIVLSLVFDSQIALKNLTPGTFDYLGDFFEQIGVEIRQEGEWSRPIKKFESLKPFCIKTEAYPGFPTDAQPLAALLACLLCEGESVIEENIFENRFAYLLELIKMGADVKIEGHKAIIRRVKQFSNNYVGATDLRSAMSLVIAGLKAGGISVVSNARYIDRGYGDIDKKLLRLGADILRKDKFFKIMS